MLSKVSEVWGVRWGLSVLALEKGLEFSCELSYTINGVFCPSEYARFCSYRKLAGEGTIISYKHLIQRGVFLNDKKTDFEIYF